MKNKIKIIFSMNKKMIIYIVQQKINFKIINSFIQNNISIYNKIIKNKT
jgi:hypothetical protein